MTKNESSEKAMEESNRFVRVFLTVVVLLCIGFIAAMWWAALQGMQKPPTSTPPLTNWQWATLGAVLSLLAYWLFPRLVATIGAFTARAESPSDTPGAPESPKPALPATKVAAASPSSPTVITINAPRERSSVRSLKASRPKE